VKLALGHGAIAEKKTRRHRLPAPGSLVRRARGHRRRQAPARADDRIAAERNGARPSNRVHRAAAGRGLQPFALPYISAMILPAGMPRAQRLAVLRDRFATTASSGLKRLHSRPPRSPLRRYTSGGNRTYLSGAVEFGPTSLRSAGSAASGASKESMCSRSLPDAVAVLWMLMSHALQGGDIALGQPQLARLEQAAHDFAAAGLRRLCWKSISLGATTAPRRLARVAP